MPQFPGTVEVDQDAPDVMIVGVDVVRSIIQAHQPEDDDDVDGVGWFVQGARYITQSDESGLRLFGDLAITEDGTFVGVTSLVLLAFRGPSHPKADEWTPELVDAYTRRYGPWASHVLYDTAAACARRLAAQSFFGGPVVPIGTPTLTIVPLLSEHEAI